MSEQTTHLSTVDQGNTSSSASDVSCTSDHCACDVDVDNVTASEARTETENAEHVRPAVDIVEWSDAVTVTADVPGATESTIDIEVENGHLRLSARSSNEGPSWSTPTPRRARVYRRTFRLSDQLDATAAEAVVANGVITIRLPKKPEAVASKIPVRRA